MAKRTVEESSLTMVADAIREGSGTTGDMEFPGEFQERAKSMANAVKFTEQTLTEEQKAQVKANIGVYENCVTPEMFGAVGDGVTDDSAAFTNAILSGKKVICDGTKEYYFANPIDARTLYQGYLDGNNAWFVNFHLYVNLNDNLTDWRHAYSTGRFIVENMNFGRRNGYGKLPEGWETPLITTGAPMTIRNINTRYPYVLATVDEYIDHMQLDTWTRMTSWDAFDGLEVNLDTISCLNKNGEYCRFDDTDTPSAAGDSWNFKQCNEFYSTKFPDYKFFRVTRRQPIVAESCVQSAFVIGLFSKASFIGCHWESCDVTFTQQYLVKVSFLNCFFYNNHVINNDRSTIYQNCYFRCTIDAPNRDHTLADTTSNVSFYDMQCVLDNCCFGGSSLIDTRKLQSDKHLPKKTYNYNGTRVAKLNTLTMNATEYTGESDGIYFPEVGSYTYDIYLRTTSLPNVANDSATFNVTIPAVKSSVGLNFHDAVGGFSVVMIRTDPNGNMVKTEYYENPNEYDDPNTWGRIRFNDYGSYAEFQLVDGRPEYPMPWIPIDEKPTFTINENLYEANGALVTSDGSDASLGKNGFVQVNKNADSTLSTNSTNSVQNKVVAEKFMQLESLLQSHIYPDLLYRLPNETTFDGSAGQQIVTDVKLFDEPKDFTIFLDVTGTPDDNLDILESSFDANNKWVGGVTIKTNASWYSDGFMVRGCPSNGGVETFSPCFTTGRAKLAVVYVQGVPSKFYHLTEEATSISTNNPNGNGVWDFVAHDGTVVIGATPLGGERFIGTIHALEIYDKAFTAEEVETRMGSTEPIVFDTTPEDVVLYSEQNLTEEQQMQARTNIGAASILYENYVTPQMFGAVADGSTDDTSAIQTAIDSGEPVFFPKGVYLTASTVHISNKNSWSMFAECAEIKYIGTDYAFNLAQNSHIKLHFGNIVADNGGCVYIGATSYSDWNQYVYLNFRRFVAKTNCIYGKVTGAELTNITVQDGVLVGEGNGVVFEGNAHSLLFKNLSLVNSGTGFILDAGTGYIQRIMIDGCMHPNNSSYVLLKTVGSVNNSTIISTCNIYTTNLDLSESANEWKVIAPIVTTTGASAGLEGEIDGGLLIPKAGYLIYRYGGSNTSIDLTSGDYIDAPTYIITGGNLEELHLTKIYGRYRGINRFILVYQRNGGTPFTIYDHRGNVIFNNTANIGWSTLEFEWETHGGMGAWTVTKLNTISPLVTTG